ncbi:hypothetical protein [Sodalis-like endosymbiont of Proechinophthirus fluctus]|uniref:hypothetical protein n=1 Tax=Sodalis-like endosymbiont of Proechinophthirus fluctus TaxID=1462730 RepID=UPI00082C4057|nr:hypothetical protein [Sodalis-like endosymbiont of Proechinophthirus fluctus]
MVGRKLYSVWQSLISGSVSPLMTKIQLYIGKAAIWLLDQVVNLGKPAAALWLNDFVQRIALYLNGERVGMAVQHFAIRLRLESGSASVLLTVLAIRALALDVVLTTIVQAVLGNWAWLSTGIPLATVLTAIMFVLCIGKLDSLMVLIPAMIWLYWTGDTNRRYQLEDRTTGVELCRGNHTLDNMLRPIFIRMGANLSMLLVLCVRRLTGLRHDCPVYMPSSTGSILAFGVLLDAGISLPPEKIDNP